MTPARRSTCSIACALIVVASAGCEAPGNPRLAALSSPGGTYEVHLTGRVTRARIFENRVRAEVFKNGAPHLPARLIFAAGLFDTAFNERFGSPEWAASNVLRFPGRAGAAAGAEPDSLTLRNVSDQPFPSIRIETARDMFLVFDLAPRAEMTLPTTAPVKTDAPNWFDVVVDSGNPDALLRGHGTFTNRSSVRPRFTFAVTVSANGVEVAETTGHTKPPVP